VYGAEWLIGLALLGGLAGLAGGYLLAGRNGGNRQRELEAQLSSARRELGDYRQEVVQQFSETARKFQALNDSYTDLHEQLARSSSVLCGDISGPLLEAPAGHQDLIPAEVREPRGLDRPVRDTGDDEAVTESPDPEAVPAAGAVDPYEDTNDIRVAEPTEPVATDTDTPTPDVDAGEDPQTPRSATGN
jgi:uncharacterized membrane-anchored protein YhcB (DUF1043 family)